MPKGTPPSSVIRRQMSVAIDPVMTRFGPTAIAPASLAVGTAGTTPSGRRASRSVSRPEE